jgi:dihydroorotate dehydrogenase electron transfer subunit
VGPEDQLQRRQTGAHQSSHRQAVAKSMKVTHNDSRMIPRRDLPLRLVASDRMSPSCFHLKLAAAETFVAKPGQFGMLITSDGFDPLLRRAFSLAGVMQVGGATIIELMIKEVGKGTSLLRRVPVGAEVRMLAPLGNGFDLEPPGDQPFALVAGGIGLPPMLFAAEVLAQRGIPFDLYIGATTAEELFEVERSESAVRKVGGELVLTTDDGSRANQGFVTQALLRHIGEGRHYGRVLACGPNPMLAALAAIARDKDLDVELSLEEPMACGVGVCLGCVVELFDGSVVPSCKEGPVFKASRLAARWEL